MIEFVYVVTGICRDFDGETTATIIGARKEQKAAKELGASWVKDKKAEIKMLGVKWHASYKLDLVELR